MLGDVKGGWRGIMTGGVQKRGNRGGEGDIGCRRGGGYERGRERVSVE